mgnify:CR=1 FL=1|tara:strand:+ start:4051 stop:4917 length:867 start_codon:yes stop_codon:yes gene_type:complete
MALNLNKIKLGIIGANSFLGDNLCEVLIKKKVTFKKFFSYKKNKKDWINKILNEVKSYKPDLIIYCSSAQLFDESEKTIKELINTNILAQLLVIKKALRNKNFKGFITFGSKWEYDQKGNVDPLNFYAASKASADIILKLLSKDFNLPIVSLKLPDTFGNNDKRNKILNIIRENYKKNRTSNLTPGNQYLDLVNINDIINLILIILNEILKNKVKGFQVYSASSRQSIKLIDLISNLNKILSKKLKVKFGVKKYRKKEQMYYIKNNFNHPKWRIKNSLNSDLKVFFEF